jgi:hypothetical protein
MNKFTLGIGLMVTVGIIALACQGFAAPLVVSLPLCLPIALAAVILETQYVLNVKREFDRSLATMDCNEQEHIAFMQSIATLPSAEADELIVQRLKLLNY